MRLTVVVVVPEGRREVVRSVEEDDASEMDVRLEVVPPAVGMVAEDRLEVLSPIPMSSCLGNKSAVACDATWVACSIIKELGGRMSRSSGDAMARDNEDRKRMAKATRIRGHERERLLKAFIRKGAKKVGKA